jgi:hypothetical protein
MDSLLLAAAEAGGIGINDMWYALPLIVAVSLVYSATRHEEVGPILAHAVRIGIWIVGLMAVIFAVLLLISWGL